MAREKDEGKRQSLMESAKELFAKNGFHGTSIADLANATGLPTGSVYTYFKNKEDLIRAVIEEGWGEYFSGLQAELATTKSAERKLAIIVYRALPALFNDIELISLLLFEAPRYAALAEKLDSISQIVGSLVAEIAGQKGKALAVPVGELRAAIGIYLLGSLDTVRLSNIAGLGIPVSDITDFIRYTIESTLGIMFDPALAM